MAKNGGTKTVDKGFNRIRKDLKVVDRSSIDVGILGGGQVKGTSVAAYGSVNEFGTDRAGPNNNTVIPERSFLRSTFDENRSLYSRLLKSLMGDVLLDKATVSSSLKEFGDRVVSDIQKKIEDIKSPPNAPSTIEQKGFNDPLVNTGRLKDSIKRRVKL